MRRVVAVVLLGAALCGGCGGSSDGQVPAGQVASAKAAGAAVAGGRCPGREPPYVAGEGTGLGGSLVPFRAGTLILCRYDGLNGPHPLGLAAERTVSDAATVEEWRRRFDALPKPAAGRFNCPDDDESAVLAGFLGGKRAVVVKVDLRGCRLAGNGATSRSAGGSFLDDLTKLAG